MQAVAHPILCHWLDVHLHDITMTMMGKMWRS
jgi:hypothetical protein